MMRPVKSFHVRPALPDRLKSLETLAYNLRWSWSHDTISLFRRIDRELWEECGHNPVLLLGSASQARMNELARDEAFLAHMDRVAAELEEYMTWPATWYNRQFGPAAGPLVAYFSMEFGITECLPIYSGGLGVLAGDHLKSASELGVPLVGVGLLYQKGYFRQYLTNEGWQHERYPVNDFSTMPVRPLHGEKSQPLRITVDLGGRPIILRPWRAQIGRLMLVLLDSNIPENPRDLQDVTDELYGGDSENRIRQEMVLGIGGVRMLKALGLEPNVFHMNEGHCAFLGLERVRQLMNLSDIPFSEALEIVAASGIFTTHTPVPAGIDEFPAELAGRYLSSLREEIGLSRDELLDLGRVHPGKDAPFSMAVLAMRTAGFVNGVSRLHGNVSRAMWRDLWPGVPQNEIPITHITNGVHPQSWISAEMQAVYDRYLGPRWAEEPGDTRVWVRAGQIPGEELWRTHERRREHLVGLARRRLTAQLGSRGANRAEIDVAAEVLDPEALTIGFGRRFATYKRATLILRDPARLERLLNAPGRPVQVIFAGKAHPRDDPGKELIRTVIQLVRRPEFRHRIVFLEDYDQVIARYMVQGADVWLNTPRRPLEASGTSGMKAAFNGALNLSVLDGWWDEAHSLQTGWAIGRGEDYSDPDYQDQVESGALYDLLENEVVPIFYNRASNSLPRGWIAMMQSAMQDLCPVFNTNRMVHEYVTAGYVPARARRALLEEDAFSGARDLAAWKVRVRENWGDVRIEDVDVILPAEMSVGKELEVRAWVRTGRLGPEDLEIQACLGRLPGSHEMVGVDIFPMENEGPAGDGQCLFTSSITCSQSGTQGITIRGVPRHPLLAGPFEMGLVTWAKTIQE